MLITPLSEEDFLEKFDCGIPALNIFITKNALNYQKSYAAKTYLLKSNNNLVGFYSISATIIEQNQIDVRWPKHPLPAILLGRLAVDVNYRGHGLGGVLFADACKKAIAVSDIIGCVGLVTDSKDENALKFYTHFGMRPFINKPMTLYIKMKDILKYVT